MPFRPEIRKPLSVGEVAERMGVATRTVVRWADSGKLPYFRSLGGHRRFAATDIDALLAGSVEKGGTA